MVMNNGRAETGDRGREREGRKRIRSWEEFFWISCSWQEEARIAD
jgi:hypothetical protein